MLKAADAVLARAEADGVPDWWELVDFDAPEAWPPPHCTPRSQQWFAAALRQDPDAIGWYAWYVARMAEPPARPRLAGVAGFLGRPDAHGTVEIGYTLLPRQHGFGYGTELVAALAAWAFETPVVQRIVAETYLEYAASVRVLEKNGFTAAGRGRSAGTLRFELRRAVFAQRRPAGSTAL